MSWTRFMDMNSGGGQKEKWAYIFIEAPADEAKVIFYNRFGHNPERVTCTCCGEDYSTNEAESLEQVTAYNRNCRFAYFRPDGTECPDEEGWVCGKGMAEGYTSRYVESGGGRFSFGSYVSLPEYLKSKDILVIRAEEIKPDDRAGTIPQQGYVWVD